MTIYPIIAYSVGYSGAVTVWDPNTVRGYYLSPLERLPQPVSIPPDFLSPVVDLFSAPGQHAQDLWDHAEQDKNLLWIPVQQPDARCDYRSH